MPWHSSPNADDAASRGKLADLTHPKSGSKIFGDEGTKFDGDGIPIEEPVEQQQQQCPFSGAKAPQNGTKAACPFLTAPLKAANPMQTHLQGPLQADRKDIGPLTPEELEQCKKELADIKEKTGWAEPDRGETLNNPSPDTEWLFGAPPDYTLANLEFFKYKSKHHAPGSLEQVVENLVKTWEFERSHKSNPNQHTVANHEGFSLSANQGKQFGHLEAHEVGNYNALLESASAELWDQTAISNRDSHEIFHAAFPAFAWEILAVHTGPPTVHFQWRHFGRFTGEYKGHRGNGEMVDMRGHGIAKVNDRLQLLDTQIFYDQETFLKVMEGKLPVSAQGHPTCPETGCVKAIDNKANWANPSE